MSTITVTLTATKPQTFPTGTVAGQMRFRLISGNLPVSNKYLASAPFDAPVAFTNVADGTYAVEVQRFSSQSGPLGSAIVASVTVTSTPVIVDVPDTMSIEVTP